MEWGWIVGDVMVAAIVLSLPLLGWINHRRR
jgi:hypothetical protein